MNATEAAAWWGAIVATVVLIWDAFKWFRSGPRLRVRANPNMQSLNGEEGCLDPTQYIFLDVSNIGDRATTITHVVVYQYESWLKKWLKKPSMQGVVTDGALGPPVPYVINPGERWTGGINQRDLMSKCERGRFLYCGVIHSGASKPVLAKLDLNELTAAEEVIPPARLEAAGQQLRKKSPSAGPTTSA